MKARPRVLWLKRPAGAYLTLPGLSAAHTIRAAPAPTWHPSSVGVFFSTLPCYYSISYYNRDMKHLSPSLACLLLAGCAGSPELLDNPYQARASALVAAYNARHGSHVPVPVVRVGSLPDLEEGHTYCPAQAAGLCWITVNAPWGDSRHGQGYAISNTLPHELAHSICIYTNKCPRGPAGNYHGPEWQALALELGLPPEDSFLLHQYAVEMQRLDRLINDLLRPYGLDGRARDHGVRIANLGTGGFEI